MKCMFSSLFALLAVVAAAVPLNDGWTADGKPVVLPHCWNVADGTDGPTDPKSWNHDSVAGTGYARRQVAYRRTLSPSPKMRYLRVNAASIRAVVKLDGREIGRHDGAFTAFTVPIPPLEKAADLEIDVNNFYTRDVPPVCGDFTMYGGLYRGVDLLDEPEDFSAPTGLPECEFRDGGFYVNGQRTFLKGVCYHQDREGKGWAISAADEEADIRLIRAMGANAIRTSHYPRSERFYDLCDKYGLYVWTEIPLVDLTVDSATFRSNTLAVAREMVLQHRKHKCIVMWGLFNELYLSKMPDGQAEPLVREVKALVASLDPRPTVAASCMTERRELNAIPDGLGFNLYPGWYGGKSVDLNAEIELRRTKNGRAAVAISEYGAGGSLGQTMPTPDFRPEPGGAFHPVDYQLKVHREGWESVRDNPNLWGYFIWVMFDAGSDSRREGARNGINDKGLVDFTHTRTKPAYDFYRRAWGGAASDVAQFDARIAADVDLPPDEGLDWTDGRGFPLESKVCAETATPYGRIPADLMDVVPPGVRGMAGHSTGHYFLLTTDSGRLGVRWRCAQTAAPDPYIPPQGMYGVDIYVKANGIWRFVKNGRLKKVKEGGVREPVWQQTQVKLDGSGRHEVLVYLPIRAEVLDVSFGVDAGKTLSPGRHDGGVTRPVVHYGTSIVHGGCVSRPGLLFTAQAARELDVPYVNLGFSGSARLEPEMADVMARADALLYIVDPVWNCSPDLIAARCEPFLRRLHRLRPETPVLLCEGGEPQGRLPSNGALRKVYDRLVSEGSTLSKRLHYLSAEGLLPTDGDATHDNCHPNDYGARQMGRVFSSRIRALIRSCR